MVSQFAVVCMFIKWWKKMKLWLYWRQFSKAHSQKVKVCDLIMLLILRVIPGLLALGTVCNHLSQSSIEQLLQGGMPPCVVYLAEFSWWVTPNALCSLTWLDNMKNRIEICHQCWWFTPQFSDPTWEKAHVRTGACRDSSGSSHAKLSFGWLIENQQSPRARGHLLLKSLLLCLSKWWL